MSTTTRTRKPVKVTRHVRVLSRLNADGKDGQIEITIQRGRKVEVNRYWIDQLASDFGMAFHVEKQGDGTEANEEYHVNIENAQDAHCDCRGFSRWGRCKHVDSLKKLVELDRL